MHLRHTPQRLGAFDWGGLFSTVATLGTKVIDRSTTRASAEIARRQAELENRRAELERAKMDAQERILSMQESQSREAAPAGIPIPGLGRIPLTYLAIPAVIALVLLLRRK